MAAASAPWKPGVAWLQSLAAVETLLPTPVASDRDRTEEEAELRHLPGRAMGRGGGASPDLSSVVKLLPTPQARDKKGPPGTAARENGGFQASLPASIRDLRDGDGTGPQSRDGKAFSDEPLPLQWSGDEPGSG
jgi:hypothetical protein